MQYIVINIKYDTDGEAIDLPETLTIDVPSHIEPEEVGEFISDEISNQTGFCHFGFNTIPEIE
jgi:hypothetical protein